MTVVGFSWDIFVLVDVDDSFSLEFVIDVESFGISDGDGFESAFV